MDLLQAPGGRFARAIRADLRALLRDCPHADGITQCASEMAAQLRTVPAVEMSRAAPGDGSWTCLPPERACPGCRRWGGAAQAPVFAAPAFRAYRWAVVLRRKGGTPAMPSWT
jgi:hypothetical protein